MAVIIDMDMPKSCVECPLIDAVHGTCSIDNHFETFYEKEDCPLKSADEMIKEIKTDMSWDMYDENGNETDLHKRLMSIIHKYTDK